MRRVRDGGSIMMRGGVVPAVFLAGLASVASLAGCAASPYSRAGGGVATLTVRPVDWNPSHAPITGVRAVADAGGEVVAFADGAATILSGGRVVAVDRSVERWVSAGTLPAADGGGTWIIGVDGEGRVRRLHGRATLEPVSGRYGLEDAKVSAIASLGGRASAFQLENQIAIADGREVTRYATGPFGGLAGGGGKALLGGTPLRLFDVGPKQMATYATPRLATLGSARIAVTAQGKVYLAGRSAIWGEDEHGDLHLRFETRGTTIHGLAASANRVWFADGAELGVIEGDHVRETIGAKLDTSAELAASPSGDVWTLARGELQRFSVQGETKIDWASSVAPVFHRACEQCHKVGGEADAPLVTEGDWQRNRDLIQRRVFVDRDMPPPGHAITDADRAAIQAWIEHR